MKLKRSVTVPVAIDQVFAYLSDFTTTEEWDPGTVRTELVSGDGDVGTVYHNVSKFMGRETELTYTVIRHEPGNVFVVQGKNSTLTATDTMTFVADGDQSTTVTYEADFAFNGIARFVAPLLSPAFTKLGDEAEKGLQRSLSKL